MENKSRVVMGIVGTPTYDSENFSIVCIYDNYKRMMIEKNVIPFVLPPIASINYAEFNEDEVPPLTENEKDMYRDMVDMCDGIIIPGGYHIYNYHYFIINYALENNIPILGTCMGMQALACVDNGKYCLALNSDDSHKQGKEQYVHNVSIKEGTLLSNIIGESNIKVNSSHKYHVEYANNYIVSAYSDDGLIEAIEDPNHDFVVGVQWHPEKMISYDLNANKLIDAFIVACKKRKLDKEVINGRSL